MATVTSDQKPTAGGPWYFAGQVGGINTWTTSKPGGGASGGGSAGSSSSGSSSSGSGGGGGGGGGSADKSLSTYVQEYRLRFRADGSPPPELLKQAKNGNWSVAYFDQQVRLKDPHYMSSMEAKSLLPSLNQTLKILFPGLADETKQKQLMKSGFYKNVATWYLRNGVGTKTNGDDLLYAHITNTRKWNVQNPYWKIYATNPNAAVQAEVNPLAYKSHMDALKQSFADYGLQMSDDYYRQFFKSHYATTAGLTDLGNNLKTFAQTAGSQGWFQNAPVTHEQTKTAVLGEGIGATDLRSKMQQHFGVQSSFLGSTQQGFGVQENKQGRLVESNL